MYGHAGLRHFPYEQGSFGKRMKFREDPGASVADRSLKMVTALSAEVVVLRERLEIFERLAVQSGMLQAGEIDHFHPEPELAAELKSKRLSLIGRVFGALKI